MPCNLVAVQTATLQNVDLFFVDSEAKATLARFTHTTLSAYAPDDRIILHHRMTGATIVVWRTGKVELRGTSQRDLNILSPNWYRDAQQAAVYIAASLTAKTLQEADMEADLTFSREGALIHLTL